MGQNRKLLIALLCLLAVFLAASLGLYFDVFSFLSGTGQGDAGSETIVSMIPVDEVTAVAWSEGTAPEFALEKDDQGSWFCPEYRDVELDQSKVASTLSALCQVVSSRRIEEPDDAASYGLSPVRRRVEITLTDGETFVYRLGDLNSYTNRYYFQMEPDSAVYMVGYSVGQSMEYGILDYAVNPEILG